MGARNRIAMADLRKLMQDLGFDEAQTHLQSGNVVFGAGGADEDHDLGAVAEAIQEGLRRELGLDVPVIVRTAQELRRVVAANPLRQVATNPSRLLVSFLSGRIDRSLLTDLDESSFAPDAFALGEREIYVWAPNGASETKLTHAFWERRLGLTATARNWNTVERLLELASS